MPTSVISDTSGNTTINGNLNVFGSSGGITINGTQVGRNLTVSGVTTNIYSDISLNKMSVTGNLDICGNLICDSLIGPFNNLNGTITNSSFQINESLIINGSYNA
jgi:cytoskeletal protein CcmA (bactofilin family)